MKPAVALGFSNVLKDSAPKDLDWTYVPMPTETHATIHHLAALRAFRKSFKPVRRGMQAPKTGKIKTNPCLAQG